MSRVGAKPIELPQGVEVAAEDSLVRVKGPKGELARRIPEEISVQVQDGTVLVVSKGGGEFKGRRGKRRHALWGLTRTLLSNMVQGVTEGFVKRLEIEGVGYRAQAAGDELELSMGFSHPVKLAHPEGVEVAVDQNVVTVSGIDKEKVGEFAARIRRVRPVEPYKGKGIRYEGERVRRKLGKRAVGSE